MTLPDWMKKSLVPLCLPLLCLTAACGGAPEESSSLEAMTITPVPIRAKLTCSPNYPFYGLQITNIGSYPVPAGVNISYTAKFANGAQVSGSTPGPLDPQQLRNVWVAPINGYDPVSCTASASWSPDDA
jgi:hypothetical protein